MVCTSGRWGMDLRSLPEVALNFKDQGNEYFKGRRYREALGFYTQGVDAKPEDLTLLEALLLNRAACNLELRLSPFSVCEFLFDYTQKIMALFYETVQRQ